MNSEHVQQHKWSDINYVFLLTAVAKFQDEYGMKTSTSALS